LAGVHSTHFSQERYDEFSRASRLWQHLALERRSGQAFGIDGFLKHRRANSLALRCPACPEVGFNVNKSTIDMADESEAYVYSFLHNKLILIE